MKNQIKFIFKTENTKWHKELYTIFGLNINRYKKMARWNCLDFISTSPHFYIFENERNKTNFCGFLFLAYIIIMIFYHKLIY